MNIQKAVSIALTGGAPLTSLPGVESAFVDVLLLTDVEEMRGGTGQLTLVSDTVQILGRLGAPVEFTFAVVVLDDHGRDG